MYVLDYEWILKSSSDARACVTAFNQGNLLEHAKSLIEMVKTGYTREELHSFLETLYANKINSVKEVANDQSYKRN